MEIPNSYPFGLSNAEIISIVDKCQKRLSTEIISEGEKESLSKIIQVGQNQIVSNNISQNLDSIKNQSGILTTILNNNNTTSRNSKFLSYIMIVIALVTLYLSFITIRGDKTKQLQFKQMVDSISVEIENTNTRLDSVLNYMQRHSPDTVYSTTLNSIDNNLSNILKTIETKSKLNSNGGKKE